MNRAWAEVSRGALRKNIRFLMSRTNKDTKFMGVVKADGYGHGAIEVTTILQEEGADQFAVAFWEEGAQLRAAGFKEPILILGATFEEEFPLIIENNLTVSVISYEHALSLNEVARKHNKTALVHIKIDTGMGRLGFLAEDPSTVDTIKQIANLSNIKIEGIFTHFATAPQISDTTYCECQFAKFQKLNDLLEQEGIRIPLKHASNSGATVLFPQMQLDMVRPGTAIFGLYAGEELMDMPDIEVHPAMEIKARIAFIKKAPIGTHVSYTGSFVAKRDSVLGIAPLGYVDGIFRNLANRGEVLVHGQRCPIVGNVCMDQFVIDLTDVENPMVGDEITIVGKQGAEFITAEEIGEKCGTISIEVLCGLGKRIPIVYVD